MFECRPQYGDGKYPTTVRDRESGASTNYEIINMEEEAIVTAVHPATAKSLGEGLEIESLHMKLLCVTILTTDS
jgi:hypothetical protein